MTKIGLFFCTQEGLIACTYDKQEGKQQGVFIIPTEGHDRVWRSQYEQEQGVGYDYWPRGRVAYNTSSRQYVVYHDTCIQVEEIQQVIQAFGIQDEDIRYTVDEYYSCHACSKTFMDDESMFDSF